MISIILPVYNAEKTLRRLLEGIVAQKYQDFELLLVNDGSCDSSYEIIEEFAGKDNRIRVFHKMNGGASSARNLALSNIRGEYVAFCDSDDCVDADWLQHFAEHIEGNDVVVQGWKYVKENSTSKEYYSHQCQCPAYAADMMSAKESFGFLWNKCFRTSIISNQHLRFNESFRFLEDEEFICRYWVFVRNVSFVHVAAYNYQLPDFNTKYTAIDNYTLYLSLLDSASQFIRHTDSVTMRKYTMGVFRNMMLSYQKHLYAEGWTRLKQFVRLGQQYHQYNRYMRLMRPWNYVLWHPFLMVYNWIK